MSDTDVLDASPTARAALYAQYSDESQERQRERDAASLLGHARKRLEILHTNILNPKWTNYPQASLYAQRLSRLYHFMGEATEGRMKWVEAERVWRAEDMAEVGGE